VRYKLLGKSGLRVSELCLGTMTFGQEWGFGEGKDESCKVFELFAEAGGNFIDTANKYTEGTSEKFVGEFVAADRERFVIATKYSLCMNPTDPNAGGNHRKNLVQSLEASLRRLKTSYIDLLWVHAWDGMTPVEEIMRALDDQIRAGKVLYVGISDTPAWRVAQANTMATLRGWTPFVGLQIKYNLAERSAERDLLPMAQALDLAVTPWGVLGGGMLTGKYLDAKGQAIPVDKTGAAGDIDTKREDIAQQLDDRKVTAAREVVAIAQEIGQTPSQVALNWLRQQRQALIIPILGARTQAQLADNLGCLDFQLTQEQLDRLTAASPLELGFPHDFLGSETVRPYIFGEMEAHIDNHHSLD
jgi:aryl-alcohol dehydrogenase-like predicted oxidoreductase